MNKNKHTLAFRTCLCYVQIYYSEAKMEKEEVKSLKLSCSNLSIHFEG